MSQGLSQALRKTNIAIISYNYTIRHYFARHKDNNLPPDGKLSFNVFFVGNLI